MPDNTASIRRKSPNERLKTKLNEFNVETAETISHGIKKISLNFFLPQKYK